MMDKLYVPPSCARLYLPYYGHCDTVGLSENACSDSVFNLSTDTENLFFVQSGIRMLATTLQSFRLRSRGVFVTTFESFRIFARTIGVASCGIVATLFDAIYSVFFVSSESEVGWVATRSIVTQMHHDNTRFARRKSGKLGVISKFVGETMCSHKFPTVTSQPIAIMNKPSPWPTLIWGGFGDFIPEVLRGASIPGGACHD